MGRWSGRASPPKFLDAGRWGGMLEEGPRVLGPRLRAPLLWGSDVLGSARAGRWAWGTPGGDGAHLPFPESLREGRSGWLGRPAGSLGFFCSLAAQTPGSGLWHQYRPRSQIVTIVSALILTQAMGRTAAQVKRGERALGWKIAFSYQDLLGIYLQMSFPTEAVSTHQKRCLRESHALLVSVTGKAKGSGSLRERET